MELDVLPKELADSLLQEMLKHSKDWELSPAIIFQKLVYSSHTTALYVQQNEKSYYYNGSEVMNKRPFTLLMQEAADIIANRVNDLYPRENRSSLEISGEWRPDIAVVNHYAGPHDSVGTHSDKLTYIGPRPVIASLTLGATRTFRLRRIAKGDVKGQTYDILLPHNTLLLMMPPCQEEYKHEVPKVGTSLNSTLGTLIQHPISGKGRICLTFRMTRPEYGNKPAELRPVIKKEKSTGKYFYFCGMGKCTFFSWMDQGL